MMAALIFVGLWMSLATRRRVLREDRTLEVVR